MSRRSLLRLQGFWISGRTCVHTKVPIIGSRGSYSTPDREILSVTSSKLFCSAGCLGLRARELQESSSLALSRQLLQARHFLGEGAPAKHHHERRLLGYTQQQLYNVVSDVAHYKEFVPWCQRSVVLQTKPPDFVEAELEVGFKMFVERYKSQVYLTAPSKVLSKVSDSTLFDHLDTTWEFKSGPTPSTTWLSFDIDFAFKSPLYRHIAGIFFDEVVKRMMNAFEERCKQLYGQSALQLKRKAHA